MQRYVEFEKESGDVYFIPVYEEDGVEWYPVSFISQKVLDRQKLTSTELMRKYGEYLSKKGIIYKGQCSYIEANCLNYDGFNLWVNNMHIGRMNKIQKVEYNKMCDVFKVGRKVEEREIYLDKLDGYDFDKYDEYTKDCHDSILGEFDRYKLCTTCQTYYPNTSNFFDTNEKIKDGLFRMCKHCSGNHSAFLHDDYGVSYVYKTFGVDKYLQLKSIGKMEFMKSNMIYIKYFDNKEYELEMIKHLKNNNLIERYSIAGIKCTLRSLCRPKNFKKVNFKNNLTEIYEYIFSDEDRLKPYLANYVNTSIFNYSNKDVKDIFWNYVDYKNIKIKDIFDYDYIKPLVESKATIAKSKDRLETIVMLYDHKYPAYKFKQSSVNYWSLVENRISEMKMLIGDMNMENIDKLPLYLTKNKLNSISNTMTNVLKVHYSNELFDWINDCYPDKFKPEEFNIWYRRDEFDSIEEEQVHGVLKDKFKNKLLYNSGDSSNRLTIDRSQPDWIVFDIKPIIIEYFGLYNLKNMKSKRVSDYVRRSDIKIEKYTSLEHYDSIFIFPEDLKNNFDGVRKKICDY